MTNFNFEYDQKTDSYILTSYLGDSKDVLIPMTYKNKLVGIIGESAFEGRAIETIRFPDTILEIRDYAFAGCDNLKIKGSLPRYLEKIGEGAFTGVYIEDIEIPPTCTYIGDIAFDNYELRSIKLPDRIEVLPIDLLGGCYHLKEISLPRALKKISRSLLERCENLEKVFISHSVKLIEEDAFKDCISLKLIEYDGSQNDFNNIKIESGNEYLMSCKVICSM